MRVFGVFFFKKKDRLQRDDTSPVMFSESKNEIVYNQFLRFFGYCNDFECLLLFVCLKKCNIRVIEKLSKVFCFI